MGPADTKDSRFMARARRRVVLVSALLITDIVALLVAGLMASAIRFGSVGTLESYAELGPNVTYFDLALIMTPIWIGMLALERLYDLDRVFWGTNEYLPYCLLDKNGRNTRIIHIL